MYGDKLKQAIDTINEYLQQGNEVYLWDENSKDKALRLNEDSVLNFLAFSFDEEEN